jgi:SHAQKYF class myb-like DNA-binding protein
MKIINPKKTKLFKTKYLPNQKTNLFRTQKYYINVKNETPKPKLDKIPNFLLQKKTYRFNVEKYTEKDSLKTGRWSMKEHIYFLEILDKFGANWKKANAMIPNRTGVQIRTHANKFFKKLKKYKHEDLGIDFTSDSIKNLNDMIDHIKSVNSELSVFKIFLINSQNCDTNKKIISEDNEETKDKESKDDNDIIEDGKNKTNDKNQDVNIVNNFDNEKDNNSTKETSVKQQESKNIINETKTNNINKVSNDINPIIKNHEQKTNFNSVKKQFNFNNNLDNYFYDYFNYGIFSNVFNIINQRNTENLHNYLTNLKNCSFLDIKKSYSNNINDPENIEEK